MGITASLTDISSMHPRLLWDEIVADYLVDDELHLLEVAGRSRGSDLNSAWKQRWGRLSDRLGSGFYVCVAEFETPAGRLAFAP